MASVNHRGSESCGIKRSVWIRCKRSEVSGALVGPRLWPDRVALGQAMAPLLRKSAISASENPQADMISPVLLPGIGGPRRTDEGVRLNRGAGAGCGTPSTSRKDLRAS